MVASKLASLLRCGDRYTAFSQTRTRRRKIEFVVATLFMCVALSMPVMGQIDLTVNLQANDDVILNWAGGTPGYNLLMGRSGDLSAGVQLLVGGTSAISHQVSVSNELRGFETSDIVFFRVGDQSAPAITELSPENGAQVTGTAVFVTGTLSAPVSSVSVNGIMAEVNGTTFSAFPVLLAVGMNTLQVTAVAPDWNVRFITSEVERLPGNDPPTLQFISPISGSELNDATPTLQVTFSDSDGGLNTSLFRAFLDGTDQSAKFQPVGQPVGKKWQIGPADALARGTHYLQVTIRDVNGYTQSAVSHFRVNGPRLDAISPSRAKPGDIVTLQGAGFAPSPLVWFTGNCGGAGRCQGTVQSATPAQIVVQVPFNAIDGNVTVELDGLESNPRPFVVAFTTSGGPALNVVIDALNRVYYVDSNRHNVLRIEPNGTTVIWFTSPLDPEDKPLEITGIAFDIVTSTLYVVSRGAPTYRESPVTFLLSTGYVFTVNESRVPSLFLILPSDGPWTDPGAADIWPDNSSPDLYLATMQGPFGNVHRVIKVNISNPSLITELEWFSMSNSLILDLEIDSSGASNVIYVPDSGTIGFPVFGTPILVWAGNTPALDNGTNFRALSINCADEVFLTGILEGSVQKLSLPNFGVSEVVATGLNSPWGIDSASTGQLYVGTPQNISQVPGFRDPNCGTDLTATLSGDVPKIRASWDPTLPGGGGPFSNLQFTILTACLDDPNIPRSPTDLVYWTAEDVDDPATHPDLDTNGSAGGDNLGGPDQFSDHFSPEGSYVMQVGAPGQFLTGTEYDAAGCSKIRFHPTDAPGDNFTVTARLQTARGDSLVTSDVMTVWVTLYVELDSMGDVTGPVEEDDAVFGDIPDPDPGLLAEIFAPAYIDIVLEGPGSDQNVTFDPFVPTFKSPNPDDAGPVDIEISAQGALGRDQRRTPGPNFWSAYAQGAYQGGWNEDGDGLNEFFENEEDLGIAYGRGNTAFGKYSLIYTENIRDVAGSGRAFPQNCSTARDETYMRQAVLVHELAHQFGLLDPPPETSGEFQGTWTDDGTHGIMEAQSELCFPYFTPKQLRGIRSAGVDGGFPGKAN